MLAWNAWIFPHENHGILLFPHAPWFSRESVEFAHAFSMVFPWFSHALNTTAKSGIWARWTSPFCRFLASCSLKYDVTDAMLQDNEKMKVQYLRSLLFDLLEILQAVRTWQRNFASFQISLPWQPKSKLLSIIEKQKIYCLSKIDVQKVI